MDKLKKILGAKPLFLILLPLFFALHGFTAYYNYIPVSTALLVSAKYIALSLLLAFFFYPLYKSFLRAGILSFLIVLLYLFFGVYHDFLKKLPGGSFLGSYTFILPALLLILIVISVMLIRKKNIAPPMAGYLNLLFLVLILIDCSSLLLKVIARRDPSVAGLTVDTNRFAASEKPDIYLLLLDEYAGAGQLQSVFSFDNSSFLKELKERGFSVQENSASNYSTTLYSMASLFNMDYISNLDKSSEETEKDQFLCKSLIKNNNLTKILSGNSYKIYNYSCFDFLQKEKEFTYTHFIPSGESIYSSPTFIYRFYNEMGHRFPWLNRLVTADDTDNIKYNNNKLDSLTRAVALQQTNSPRFVYSHFLIPHAPFFYDSLGNEFNYNSNPDPSPENAYIQYLVYANKKMLSLIDHIQSSSQKTAVIVLMSDHGLRGLGNKPILEDNFMTLNAVFIPGSKYDQFYPGMTNVNQFRVILNSLFGQKIPLLKDSTSFIKQGRIN